MEMQCVILPNFSLHKETNGPEFFIIGHIEFSFICQLPGIPVITGGNLLYGGATGGLGLGLGSLRTGLLRREDRSLDNTENSDDNAETSTNDNKM